MNSYRFQKLAALLSFIFIISCSDSNEQAINYDTNKSKIGNDVGLTAPNFTLENINGKEYTLSDQRGKVVLLYFWATWCSTCKYYIPDVDDLLEDNINKPFDVIGLSVDRTESEWREYVSENSSKWIHLYDNLAGSANSQLYPYNIQGIPTILLLDKYGRIVFRGPYLDKTFHDKLASALAE